jgi:hypothetical protein
MTHLVMHIREIESGKDHENNIDNSIFIGYCGNNRYFVSGKRQDTKRLHFVPFFFYCSYKAMIKFLRLVISDKNQCHMILYNYYGNFDDISYDNFINSIHKNYEVVGFNYIGIESSVFKDMISLCRDMYN